MPAKVLKEDLDNCLIDFDKRIVVSDLLNEYGGDLREISETLQKSIAAEEKKGKKFKKTFFIRGIVDDFGNQIVTLVSEDKLPQFQKKLRDSSSFLYLLEPNGSSRSLPFDFVPVKCHRMVVPNVQRDAGTRAEPIKTSAGHSATKAEKAPESQNKAANDVGKKRENEASVGQAARDVKATKSPVEKKGDKKGISNFFGKTEPKASTATGDKQEAPAAAAKRTTDFFKNQTQSKATKSEPKSPVKRQAAEKVNKKSPVQKKKPKSEPVPLVDSSSSDDEEALDALKREMHSDEEIPATPETGVKRRRIVDSDDDEGPEVKVEKKDEDQKKPAATPAVQTFQDDDGFMITVKDKVQKPAGSTSRKSPRKASPVKAQVKQTSTTAKKGPATKTKQGSIMNFFSKK